MTPTLASHQILPGSVVVLTGFKWEAGDTDESAPFMEALVNEIQRATGHGQFVILHLGEDADVEVWGPDTDLKAKVDELLKRQETP